MEFEKYKKEEPFFKRVLEFWNIRYSENPYAVGVDNTTEGTPEKERERGEKNQGAITEMMNWVKEGHVLIVFPNEDVGTNDAWEDSIGVIIRRRQVPVVNVYIEGQNSKLFRLARKIHPLLGGLLIPREFSHKDGAIFGVQVGNLLRPEDYATPRTDKSLP